MIYIEIIKMSGTPSEQLNELNKYLEIIYTCILALAVLYVLIKLRFKLDLAGWVISVTQLLSMIFRIQVFQIDGDIQYLPVVIQIFVLGSMQFFVFEMKQIRDKILSENHMQAERAKRWNRIYCIVVIMCSALLGSCVEIAVNILKLEMSKDPNKDFQGIINILILVRTPVRAVIEIYTHTLFLSLFIFFVNFIFIF